MPRSASNSARLSGLGRAGSVALEWALVAPVLFALMIGGIDLGRYFFTAQSVRELTGIVARAAMVDNTLVGCNAARGLAARTPMLSDPAKLKDVCVSRGAGAGTTTVVTIVVSYDFSFVFSMLLGKVSEIRETAQFTW